MSQITDISPQVKDKTRCNIYIDGRFFCGMKLETVMQNRIKIGDSIDTALLEKMQFESEKATALDKAMTHLSHSMKTEKEMGDFLRKKGYLESVIAYVLQKLNGYGFVNDSEYCRQYIEAYSIKKGSRLLALELQKKGIDSRTIEENIQEIKDEGQAAFSLLKKYMKGKTEDKATLYKAFKYLLSKGFPYETAKDALSNYGDLDESD